MCVQGQGTAIMAGLREVRIPYTREPSNDDDVREAPLYSLAEVAYFLNIPKPTLHRWSRPGYNKKRELVEPLIVPADRESALFSFYNLTEAHILSVITRFHRVKLPRVRIAISELKALAMSNPEHPLLSKEFYTDGRDLFVKTIQGRQKQTINLSQFGQLGLREILDSYIERIKRDASFNPIKLYPAHQVGKAVSIIPTVSSGRPIIDLLGVPVASVWNRHRAGDSIEIIAEDYEIPDSEIEGAIAYIDQLAA
jgi:uncharacterized protein (DUF433 family)